MTREDAEARIKACPGWEKATCEVEPPIMLPHCRTTIEVRQNTDFGPDWAPDVEIRCLDLSRGLEMAVAAVQASKP